MQLITTLQVIILGIIEGFTEWLPISSTGHMKLFNSFWELQNVSDTFVETFEYVIQLAAILAVIILFWKTIFPLGTEKTTTENGESKTAIVWKKDALQLWGKVLVACIPALLALLPDTLFEKLCEKHELIEPLAIACTLIIYGVVFIIVEQCNKKRCCYYPG